MNPEEYKALEEARLDAERAKMGGQAEIPGTPDAVYKDAPKMEIPVENRAKGFLSDVKQEIAIAKYPPKKASGMGSGPRTFEQYRAYNASWATAPKNWGQQTSLYAEAGAMGTIGAIFDLMLLS